MLESVLDESTLRVATFTKWPESLLAHHRIRKGPELVRYSVYADHAHVQAIDQWLECVEGPPHVAECPLKREHHRARGVLQSKLVEPSNRIGHSRLNEGGRDAALSASAQLAALAGLCRLIAAVRTLARFKTKARPAREGNHDAVGFVGFVAEAHRGPAVRDRACS